MNYWREHEAAAVKRHNELRIARLTAANLLAGSAPIASRDEVVAEVRRKREASKFSPASGGVVNGGMGSMDAYWPEGRQGDTPTPAVLHDSNCAGKIPLHRSITPMSGGSMQQRLFRRAVRKL